MEACGSSKLVLDGVNVDNTMIPLKYRRKLQRYKPVVLFLAVVALWLVFLEHCLMGALDFCQQDKVYDASKKRAAKVSFRMVQNKPVKACPIFSLKYDTNPFYHFQDDDVMCKRATPLPDSCVIANQLFFSELPASCSHQTYHEFCHLERSEAQSWSVSCNATETKMCASNLSLGLPNPETGHMEWKTFSNAHDLAEGLTGLLKQADPKNRHFGFAFIKCSAQEFLQVSENMSDYTPYSNDYYAFDSPYNLQGNLEQLLILPPSVQQKKNTQIHESSGLDVNVNIILIDSVSRQHFFRSLKKSVSVLESIVSDHNPPAYVFDFEMFQAVKSRTFENLQALFSGFVNVKETPFSVHGMPSKPLNLSPVFQNFRKRDYRTLWIEDLCYLWEWGISKDLHFLDLNRDPADTWKLMWKKLEENGVDDIDVTASMCRILDANNMKDPFRHTNAICFNGKHQHEYMLEYLKLYQMQMNAMAQPFLTVTSTNVGHEETGQRIQTLDKDLAQYISFLTTLDNTVTFIFSDHGNAYGQFFQHSHEAQAELFHPFMFFIIPKKVALKLSPHSLSALRANTKRLISVLDMHHTLLYLANNHTEDVNTKSEFPVTRNGLFESLNTSRGCESVPRIPPNQCICHHQEKVVQSSSFQALFGYHALGIINSEIQRQFISGVKKKASIRKAYGRCQPLRLQDVRNIRENQDSSDGWKISMDIHVQDSQVFFVSIVIQTQQTGQRTVVLETVSRVTKYGQYQECADPNVELSLCICNMSAPVHETPPFPSMPQPDYFTKLRPIPHFDHSLQGLSGNQCLLIFSVTNKQGMAIFIANTCDKSFLFHLEVLIDRKHIFSPPPSKVLLLPGSFVYLALVINDNAGSLNCPLRSHSQEVKDVEDHLSLLLR